MNAIEILSTTVTNSDLKLSENTVSTIKSTFGNEYYVGDVIPDPWSSPNLPASRRGILPTGIPGLGFVQAVENTSSPTWRRFDEVGKVTLSLDVPGVRIEDATLLMNAGVVMFNGKRFDTGYNIGSTYNLGDGYDPNTAEATIDSIS